MHVAPLGLFVSLSAALLLGTYPITARAAPPLVLSTGLEITAEQLQEIRSKFSGLKEDKVFFHWTSPAVGLRWAQQGHMDAGEVAFYSKPSGTLQNYGPGLYMAESSTSSSNFGEFPLVFKMKAGTPVYDAATVRQVLGRGLTEIERAELGAHLNFVVNVTGDWWVSSHPENFKTIEYAGKYGAEYKALKNFKNGVGALEAHRALNTMRAQGLEDRYLDSFLHLLHYSDGISLERAIRIHPQDPWMEFEPENFEKYRQLREKLLNDWATSSGVSTLVQGNNFGSKALSKEEWVKAQFEDKLPSLQTALRGSKGAYRENPITAGGDMAGRRFFATPAQVGVLKDNPYLAVDAIPDQSGKGFLVKYDYPSVNNFERVESSLSKEMVQDLKNFRLLPSPDPNLAKDLQKRLTRELTEDLFRRWHGKPVDAARFMRDAISIHPFDDMNNRSFRAWTDEALIQSGKDVMPPIMSDLDLLAPPEQYADVLEESNTKYRALRGQLVEEFISAKLGRRMPNYFSVPAWKDLKQGLSALNNSPIKDFGPKEMELIRKREFAQLLKIVGDPNWDLTIPTMIKHAYEQAEIGGLKAYQVQLKKIGPSKIIQFLVRETKTGGMSGSSPNFQAILDVLPKMSRSQQSQIKHLLIGGLTSAMELHPEGIAAADNFKALLRLIPNGKKVEQIAKLQKTLAKKMGSDLRSAIQSAGNDLFRANAEDFLQGKIAESEFLEQAKPYYSQPGFEENSIVSELRFQALTHLSPKGKSVAKEWIVGTLHSEEKVPMAQVERYLDRTTKEALIFLTEKEKIPFFEEALRYAKYGYNSIRERLMEKLKTMYLKEVEIVAKDFSVGKITEADFLKQSSFGLESGWLLEAGSQTGGRGTYTSAIKKLSSNAKAGLAQGVLNSFDKLTRPEEKIRALQNLLLLTPESERETVLASLKSKDIASRRRGPYGESSESLVKRIESVRMRNFDQSVKMYNSGKITEAAFIDQIGDCLVESCGGSDAAALEARSKALRQLSPDTQRDLIGQLDKYLENTAKSLSATSNIPAKFTATLLDVEAMASTDRKLFWYGKLRAYGERISNVPDTRIVHLMEKEWEKFLKEAEAGRIPDGALLENVLGNLEKGFRPWAPDFSTRLTKVLLPVPEKRLLTESMMNYFAKSPKTWSKDHLIQGRETMSVLLAIDEANATQNLMALDKNVIEAVDENRKQFWREIRSKQMETFASDRQALHQYFLKTPDRYDAVLVNSLTSPEKNAALQKMPWFQKALEEELMVLRSLPEGHPAKEKSIQTLIPMVSESKLTRQAMEKLEPDLTRLLDGFRYNGKSLEKIPPGNVVGRALEDFGQIFGDGPTRISSLMAIKVKDSPVKRKIVNEFWEASTHMLLYSSYAEHSDMRKNMVKALKVPLSVSYTNFNALLDRYRKTRPQFSRLTKLQLDSEESILKLQKNYLLKAAEKANGLQDLPAEFWKTVRTAFPDPASQLQIGMAFKRGGLKSTEMPKGLFPNGIDEWLKEEANASSLAEGNSHSLLQKFSATERAEFESLLNEHSVAFTPPNVSIPSAPCNSKSVRTFIGKMFGNSIK